MLTQFPKTSKRAAGAFARTLLATQPFKDQSATVPKMSITFSPHKASDATTILNNIFARINAETTVPKGNVLFAVMQINNSQTPVYAKLNQIHSTQSIFSYGISDAPDGTYLYSVGKKTGVLVTGKPGSVTLPPPFDQVHSIAGHEIHDKFVVCGLNGSDRWFMAALLTSLPAGRKQMETICLRSTMLMSLQPLRLRHFCWLITTLS